jgi:RNA polymerase sigma factor (TIGR02999 family)
MKGVRDRTDCGKARGWRKSAIQSLESSMTAAPDHEITRLLAAWRRGDPAALDELNPLVHQELHRLAKRYMAGERPGHLLQPTALVNELWVRLLGGWSVEWRNRAHFFGLAAGMMRRILVDFARARRRTKRGGRAVQVPLSEAVEAAPSTRADLVALDQALQALEQLSPRQARVVELRFFGGLSLEETAEALEVSVGTVRRDWSLAEAWLFRELARCGDDP